MGQIFPTDEQNCSKLFSTRCEIMTFRNASESGSTAEIVANTQKWTTLTVVVTTIVKGATFLCVKELPQFQYLLYAPRL